MEPLQGNRVLWKAWNSCLEHQPGPGEQEYTEFSALAWIVIPWKLEQSLVPLLGELIPWIAGAGHAGKSDYSGFPSLAPRAAFNTQNKGVKCRKTL